MPILKKCLCGQMNPNARKKCSSCSALLVKPKVISKSGCGSKRPPSSLRKHLEKRANQLWASHNYHVVIMYFSDQPVRKRCTAYATPGKASKFLNSTNGIFVDSYNKFLRNEDFQQPSGEAPEVVKFQGGEEEDERVSEIKEPPMDLKEEAGSEGQFEEVEDPLIDLKEEAGSEGESEEVEDPLIDLKEEAGSEGESEEVEDPLIYL